jgi:hypothetical protein
MSKFQPGDFVACYLSNTTVYEELLQWGIVLDISESLDDILVLDNAGQSGWWPSKRWTTLNTENKDKLLKKSTNIEGFLA